MNPKFLTPTSSSADDDLDAPSQDVGMRILSYMLAGLLFYGGLGWLGDRFLGTSFLLPLGCVVGLGLTLLGIVKRFANAE